MMKSLLAIAGFLLLIFLPYRSWFFHRAIIGGDWPWVFAEAFRNLPLWATLWSPYQGNGLGGVSPVLNLDTFFFLSSVPFVQWLHLSWELVQKATWFGLFILLAAASSYQLAKTVFGKVPAWVYGVTGVIWSTNTFVLMLTGGGQMGVALAYALAPLVLQRFITLIDGFPHQDNLNFKISNFKLIGWAGLVLGIQLVFDPRIAYVTMAGTGLYSLLRLKGQSAKLKEVTQIVKLFFLSFVIAAALNAFWIIPLVILRHNPLSTLGPAYTSPDTLSFFSFADFSHALSLLHPNWPENIFGKTYFLQSEFLLLPILAFASLLFLSNRLNIFFFVLLGLLGGFLAKGVNPPFGEVYRWAFQHIPGFIMFRDPMKFYTLTAISYSILIPFTLLHLVQWLENRRLCTFFLLWLLLHHQAFLGSLGGTFSQRSIPREYEALHTQLAADTQYFRTLWVPRQHRASYVSDLHPAVEAGPLFSATDAATLRLAMQGDGTKELLENLSVGYVMIPSDVYGEIFQEDRRYSPAIRAAYAGVLDEISWLEKVADGALTIYKTPSYQPHFRLLGSGHVIEQKRFPSSYELSVTSSQPTTLLFSEQYHPGWVAEVGERTIAAARSPWGTNVFELPPLAQASVRVTFAPERFAWLGRGISLFSIVLLLYIAGRK